MTRNPHIDLLNRRLGESLGLIRGGSLPRFRWTYAPDNHYFVYDRDDRTVLKKSWADLPAPDGLPFGRAWLLAEWKSSRAFDHMGFSPQCDACRGVGRDPRQPWHPCSACGGAGRVAAIRVARVHDAAYSPHFETTLARGVVPSEELNANYIWALARQLSASIEHCGASYENWMMEEKYDSNTNESRNQTAWREQAAAGYDQWTGAMGNLEPGRRDGYLSLPSTTKDILPGFGFDNI